MAKCHVCGTRKGKRHCPALEQAICPQCCAQGRLETIACPEECTYLSGEHYQHQRRRERARSRGRRFLETTRELFPDEPVFRFAFKLQADVYYFFRHRGPVDDRTSASVLASLRDVYSPIVVPHADRHPLGQFLFERLGDRRRYGEEEGPSREDRLKVFRDLARRVERLGGEGSHRYQETLSSFFDALDFEADLDYSPEDAEEDEAPAPHRSPGGLILPS